MQDMILLVVVLVLLFGAKKLPELARGIGQSLGEFKKGRDETQGETTPVIAPSETKPKDRE